MNYIILFMRQRLNGSLKKYYILVGLHCWTDTRTRVVNSYSHSENVNFYSFHSFVHSPIAISFDLVIIARNFIRVRAHKFLSPHEIYANFIARARAQRIYFIRYCQPIHKS